jgi:deoxyribonuclease V
MSIDPLLPWTYDISEAIRVQDNLRQRLVLAWDDRSVKAIGGVDVGYMGESMCAAIAVFHYPNLDRLGTVTGEATQVFHYVPGLLAFRVGPAILTAWERLKDKPDLILIHGHGTAHPRGLGLASHIGLWLNIPTIGVAKTRLYGNHSELGSQLGEWSELMDEGDSKHVIGAVLRTQVNIKPVYVSPGHLIDLQHSIEFVLACCRGYRLPEPIRAAHETASFIKMEK